MHAPEKRQQEQQHINFRLNGFWRSRALTAERQNEWIRFTICRCADCVIDHKVVKQTAKNRRRWTLSEVTRNLLSEHRRASETIFLR